MKNKFTKEFFTEVNKCPWCGSTETKYLYSGQHNENILEFLCCSLVYSDKILSKLGLEKYWSNYLSQVQNKDETLVQKREKMYEIEYQFISHFCDLKNKGVLDVGCGNGNFLNWFKHAGAFCYGVEYGSEAGKKASQKYTVWIGELPSIEFNRKFDLIIFRGSLQYCINPKSYLKKAMHLLNKDGYLYITSSPNAQSYCFKLFKEKFTLPVSVTDYYGFNEAIITEYIKSMDGTLVCKHHFYKETPYANIENDILSVAKAIRCHQNNEDIDFKAPAFFDNMLTLVYQKNND